MERTVVKNQFVYPAILTLPINHSFADQFAFRPTGSTAASIIAMLYKISYLLTCEYEPFVIVLAHDFSKAFDSVRHVTLMGKMAQLDMRDHEYRFTNVFNSHSHCVNFQDNTSTLYTKSQPVSFKAQRSYWPHTMSLMQQIFS